MKKLYYITGVSGTGKTTLAEELNKLGYYTLDQDTISSWKHNETKEDAKFEHGIGKEFLEANDWYADIDKLKDILEEAPEVAFVCGVSANQDEYLNIFDKVFLLQCSLDTFVKRIDTRVNNDFGKHPLEKEHILNWYEGYEKHLIEQGALVINSDAPIEDVIDEILKKIN